MLTEYSVYISKRDGRILNRYPVGIIPDIDFDIAEQLAKDKSKSMLHLPRGLID